MLKEILNRSSEKLSIINYIISNYLIIITRRSVYKLLEK